MATGTATNEGDDMNRVADERMWPAEGEPIKIGWIGPLTGDVAAIGTGMRDAVELAVKEVNAEGGINGHPVEMVYENGGCEAKMASTAATKLINIDRVMAILGGTCTPETLSIAPLAEDARIPEVSASASAPSVTNAGDYVFRVVPSDAFAGQYAAQYAYNTLGKRNVGIIHSLNDYGQGIADVFAAEFERLGGTVTVKEGFADGEKDFRTALTKISTAADVDVIFAPLFPESAAAAVRQIRELGLSQTLLGADTYSDPVLQQADGLEEVIYVLQSTEENESFKEKFMAETQRPDVPVYSPQQYDAARILFDTIANVGIDGEDIKNALYQVKEYPGVSGMITFDENGDLVGAKYDVWKIENGTGVKQQ